MKTDRDRVISIVLSESEWQAFVARHPEPVHWLRERILIELQPMAVAELPGQFLKTPPVGQA
jgi:hypothetical protein